METYLLQMGKLQMEKGWESINFNQYKDILGDTFHKNIEELFNKLSATDIVSLDSACHTEYMQNVELVKEWITALNYNNIAIYPQSLVYTLKLLIKEWLPNYDKFVILITDNPYMVTYPPMELDAIYQNIQIRYNIAFEHKIVKICMPKMFSEDYLVNVCMYHEVGHFITRQNNIAIDLANALIREGASDADAAKKINHFIPCFNTPFDVKNQQLVQKYVCQIEEYIADLFAAQYVGTTVMMYLKYLRSHNMGTEDDQHPSPTLRVEMINDFLNKDNIITEKLKEVMSVRFPRTPFNVKFHRAHMDILGKLEIVKANNWNDLHSLYAEGWELFIMDKDLRDASHPSTKELTHKELYWKINNIIGESIKTFAAVNKI